MMFDKEYGDRLERAYKEWTRIMLEEDDIPFSERDIWEEDEE